MHHHWLKSITQNGVLPCLKKICHSTLPPMSPINLFLQILQNDQLMKGNGSQDQTDGERFALNQSPTSSKKSCSCWRIGNQPIAGSSGLLSRSCHHRLTTTGAMTRIQSSRHCRWIVSSRSYDQFPPHETNLNDLLLVNRASLLQDLDASSRVVNCYWLKGHETRTIYVL